MTSDDLLILIRRLRDMGAEEVSFDHIYQGNERVPSLTYIKFSQAAQLDAVVEDQSKKLAEDPRVSPEERAKILLAARERMLYGGPLEG